MAKIMQTLLILNILNQNKYQIYHCKFQTERLLFVALNWKIWNNDIKTTTLMCILSWIGNIYWAI